jgi:hypothetical protein
MRWPVHFPIRCWTGDDQTVGGDNERTWYCATDSRCWMFQNNSDNDHSWSRLLSGGITNSLCYDLDAVRRLTYLAHCDPYLYSRHSELIKLLRTTSHRLRLPQVTPTAIPKDSKFYTLSCPYEHMKLHSSVHVGILQWETFHRGSFNMVWRLIKYPIENDEGFWKQRMIILHR